MATEALVMAGSMDIAGFMDTVGSMDMVDFMVTADFMDMVTIMADLEEDSFVPFNLSTAKSHSIAFSIGEMRLFTASICKCNLKIY